MSTSQYILAIYNQVSMVNPPDRDFILVDDLNELVQYYDDAQSMCRAFERNWVKLYPVGLEIVPHIELSWGDYDPEDDRPPMPNDLRVPPLEPTHFPAPQDRSELARTRQIQSQAIADSIFRMLKDAGALSLPSTGGPDYQAECNIIRNSIAITLRGDDDENRCHDWIGEALSRRHECEALIHANAAHKPTPAFDQTALALVRELVCDAREAGDLHNGPYDKIMRELDTLDTHPEKR